MEFLWDLITAHPWLALILFGVVGQLFTPNPKKRQEARERERQSRRQQPVDGETPRTDPDEIAERIRGLFAGKSPEPVLSPEPVPMPGPIQSEMEMSHRADAGSFFDPHSIGESESSTPGVFRGLDAYAITSDAPLRFTIDPQSAIRAMMILGPPRALAGYEDDPLRSRYQSLI